MPSSGSPRPASAGRTCGPYRGDDDVDHTPMGHEYVGVVEEIGAEVQTLKVGDFVVGSFMASDNTCEISPGGLPVPLRARRPDGEVRHAGRVLAHPARRRPRSSSPRAARRRPDPLAARGIRRARHGLVRGGRRRGRTRQRRSPSVGDGAVGLLGILAARELGAERIIAMSRHADRQALAREFGANRHRRRARGRGRGAHQGAHERASARTR